MTLPRCESEKTVIVIQQREVLEMLCKLDVNKVCARDGISDIVLRNCASELSLVLTPLYRLSMSTK